MGENDIIDIGVRLARIETKLELLIDAKKDERDETNRHRDKCGKRLDDIETYIDGKKEADKAKGESAISKSSLSSVTDIVRTVIMIVTVMVTMKLLHF